MPWEASRQGSRCIKCHGPNKKNALPPTGRSRNLSQNGNGGELHSKGGLSDHAVMFASFSTSFLVLSSLRLCQVLRASFLSWQEEEAMPDSLSSQGESEDSGAPRQQVSSRRWHSTKPKKRRNCCRRPRGNTSFEAAKAFTASLLERPSSPSSSGNEPTLHDVLGEDHYHT